MPIRIVAAEIANSFAILLSFLVLILIMMDLLSGLDVSAWPGCGYVKKANSLFGKCLWIDEIYSCDL